MRIKQNSELMATKNRLEKNKRLQDLYDSVNPSNTRDRLPEILNNGLVNSPMNTARINKAFMLRMEFNRTKHKILSSSPQSRNNSQLRSLMHDTFETSNTQLTNNYSRNLVRDESVQKWPMMQSPSFEN